MSLALLKFSNAAVLNENSVAIGINAVDGGTCSAVAVGAGATVSTLDSYNIAIGYLATCTQGVGALALGATANAAPVGDSALVLGYGSNCTNANTATLGTDHVVLEYGPHAGYLDPTLTYEIWLIADYTIPAEAIAHGYFCIDYWDFYYFDYTVYFPPRDDILAYIPGAIAGTAWWFKLTCTRPGNYIYLDAYDATIVLKNFDGYLTWTSGTDPYEGRAISTDCLCLYTGSVIEIYCSYA